jgi:hypothetical protein
VVEEGRRIGDARECRKVEGWMLDRLDICVCLIYSNSDPLSQASMVCHKLC